MSEYKGNISKMGQDDFLFAGEDTRTDSRIIIPMDDAGLEAARVLRETLSRFAALLGDRMSPANPGGATIPTPDEIVDLMRFAADPRLEVEEEHRDGFRF